ncbi:MAG: nitroreductase family protein [Muribaculaceae bacterium]|nr:nitroreductase family protein [Muribaculaceae bacterium]
MKNSSYLIILLALGLVFTSYKWISSGSSDSADPVPANVQSSTISDIMTRTSVRAYSDRDISENTMDTLLHAAMAAPSAANKQPWRIVVINDKKILDTIGERFSSMTMAKQARRAVVMCGDTTVTLPGLGTEYWIQDVSAATENLLIAAHAMGLGAVWCGIYPMPERVSEFSELLKLPNHIIPMACVCLGYPAAETTPKDKWNPQHIRYNQWRRDYPREIR